MKEYLLTENEKVHFLKNTEKNLSKEEAEFITQQLIINSKEIKLNILLMKMNRGYISMGYNDFKSYVNSELPFNYDAIVKQMISASTAMKLFGANKVGFYSDNSMIALSVLPFNWQVKVIIELKKQFEKEIDEDLTRTEMTKRNIDEIIKGLSSKLYKESKKMLSQEFNQEDKSYYHEDIASDDFYVADEQEFIEKNGFSRWDSRSLSLMSMDQLKKYSYTEMHNELSLFWSVQDIIKHIETFKENNLSEARVIGSQYGHRSLVNYVCGIYNKVDEEKVEVECKQDKEEIEEFDGNDEDENENEDEDRPALDAEFFLDAEDSSTIHQFKKKRDKLRKKIYTAAENDYKKKNPKASLIMAIGDLLDEEELEATIKYYIEIYHSFEVDSEDNEQNDSDNFDEDNSWDVL